MKVACVGVVVWVRVCLHARSTKRLHKMHRRLQQHQERTEKSEREERAREKMRVLAVSGQSACADNRRRIDYGQTVVARG